MIVVIGLLALIAAVVLAAQRRNHQRQHPAAERQLRDFRSAPQRSVH